MTLISTYGLIVFTAFVPDPEARYKCGWVLIGITFTILTENILVLLYESITDSIRKGKIKLAKRKYQKAMIAKKLKNKFFDISALMK